MLGTVGPDSITGMPAGVWTERMWMEPVTENPAVGATEVWEFYNFTADAHPMHVHEVVFEVVNREGLVLDDDGRRPLSRSRPTGASACPKRGRQASRTRSSPIPGRSRASGPSSTSPGSTCGTATSSSTRTTR